MLGILILQKSIQKELEKLIKNLLSITIHPEEIRDEDKEFISDLNYDGTEFLVQEKDFSKIEVKNNICINVFDYEDKLVFPIYISDQTFKD